MPNKPTATTIWFKHEYLLSLLVLAAGLTIVSARGIFRALHGGGYDLTYNYLATRAWLAGLNPYSPDTLYQVRTPSFPAEWSSAGYGAPHPPAFFPFTAPFAIFDWQVSKALFLAGSLGLFFWLLRTLINTYMANTSRIIVIGFVGITLLMHPLNTGLANLQFTIPAAALAMVAMARRPVDNRSELYVALLSAASLAVKPQVGIIAFLYHLIFWRWKIIILGSLAYGVLTLVGAVPATIATGGFGWLTNLITTIGLVNSQQNSLTCCVNLQPLLLQLTPAGFAKFAGFVFWLVIPVLIWRFACWRRDTPRFPLDPEIELIVATLCALVPMLSLYSRPYHLIQLLPAIILLLIRLERAGRGGETNQHAAPLGLIAVSLVVFMQPISPLGIAGTIEASYAGRLPESLKLLWMLAVPLQTYLLLLLDALLLREIFLRTSRAD